MMNLASTKRCFSKTYGDFPFLPDGPNAGNSLNATAMALSPMPVGHRNSGGEVINSTPYLEAVSRSLSFLISFDNGVTC